MSGKILTKEEKSQLMKRASKVTLCCVFFLILLKFGAWQITDSISLLSSLVDSAMDLLASAVNFIAIRYAIQPADDEHRFGHGKAEYIAGFGQAMFISLSALFVLGEGFRRFFAPVALEHSMTGMGVMLVSILVTIGMVLYQRSVINRTASTAVKADLTHYSMDILTNFAVLAAFPLTTYMGWHLADPILAIAIALYILKGAWEVGQTSFQNLMDREFEIEERESIERAVMQHEKVLGLHALKTRRSGIHCFIQMHIDLDKDMPLHQAHDIADEVETLVQALHPDAEVLIHMDPVKVGGVCEIELAEQKAS